MLISHLGFTPQIHADSYISPGAVVSGNVKIGKGSCILAGAVITAEGGSVDIDQNCVIMENAVIRGVTKTPCHIGTHSLVGPHAHITGAEIGSGCFLATGCSIFNNARLGAGCVVAVNAIVHINSILKANTLVPINHIAIGDPVRLYPSDQAQQVHEELFKMGFTDFVFGFNSSTMSNFEATKEICRKYSSFLAGHQSEEVIDD